MTDLISEPKAPARSRMFEGEVIAEFDNRYDARLAVAKMLENGFPKGKVVLVSNDVYLVESVTSRSSYGEPAKSGAIVGGSTFAGLAFGLYFSTGSIYPVTMSPVDAMFATGAVGAGLFMVGYVIFHAFNKERKPISSSDEVRARAIHIEVPVLLAGQARAALAGVSE